MIATHTLATVEGERLQRAVEGLVSRAYAISLALQTEVEIRGFVKNGDGKEYGVVLSEGQAFCSCKDAMYRKGICKHAVALALYVIRHPQEKQTIPQALHIGDRVYLVGRSNMTGKLVCVSGDTVSVAWDQGGIRPLLATSVARIEELDAR